MPLAAVVGIVAGPMAATPILEHIHRKFAAGELPAVAPPMPRAGYGLVAVCSGCDGPLLPAHAAYEFDDDRATRVYRFHAPCYAVWLSCVVRDAARRRSDPRREEPREGSSAGAPALR